MTPDFDVAIVGGGPAGSATAAYLAKAGLTCALFERELFPRPHVGESLVPSSTRVLNELGLLDQMETARFPRKYGAVWTAPGSGALYEHDWQGLTADDEASIRFDEREQPGVDRPYTYHVDRGAFDLMLLQHAHRLGAHVCEGVRVARVDRDEEAMRLELVLGNKQLSATARMVVDASGRRTLVGNQLRWKTTDPVFDQYALHTWFEDFDRGAVARGTSLDNYIFVHFLPLTNSWIWQIPITDRITSVGVVTQKRHVAQAKASRQQFFWDSLATRPDLHAVATAATQLRPLTEEGDYSYAMSHICDDRLVLVGDAARFVDPIFSTGVSIALNSARLASRDIVSAAERGDWSRASFQTFEKTIRRGTQNWYNFISVYYRLNVLFTAFVKDPRYRLDVLKLLQGDVYDEDAPPVIDRMRQIVGEVERNDRHPWHHLLNDLTARAFSPRF
jgi:1H-pyrrole-2-carbonyl-[peptidyl-carrier protein] chlorinase